MDFHGAIQKAVRELQSSIDERREMHTLRALVDGYSGLKWSTKREPTGDVYTLLSRGEALAMVWTAHDETAIRTYSVWLAP